MKTICIYHSRDLDGWMSAAIVKKWVIESSDGNYTCGNVGENHSFGFMNFQTDKELNQCYFLGWDYGDDIPVTMKIVRTKK